MMGMPKATLRDQVRLEPGISNMVSRMKTQYNGNMRLFSRPKHEDTAIVEEVIQEFIGIDSNIMWLNQKGKTMRDSNKSRYHKAFVSTGLYLVEKILDKGLQADRLSIIVYYTAQAEVWRAALINLAARREDLEIHKIKVIVSDSNQGTDQYIAILDTTNDTDLGFLKSDERIITSLSRAGLGLIIIGDYDGLSKNLHHKQRKMVERLYSYCRENDYDTDIYPEPESLHPALMSRATTTLYSTEEDGTLGETPSIHGEGANESGTQDHPNKIIQTPIGIHQQLGNRYLAVRLLRIPIGIHEQLGNSHLVVNMIQTSMSMDEQFGRTHPAVRLPNVYNRIHQKFLQQKLPNRAKKIKQNLHSITNLPQ